MSKDYTIVISYTEADACYVADIPDLEHCSAFGTDPSEALSEVLTAKTIWLETAEAEGFPIPDPMYQPLFYQFS